MITIKSDLDVLLEAVARDSDDGVAWSALLDYLLEVDDDGFTWMKWAFETSRCPEHLPEMGADSCSWILDPFGGHEPYPWEGKACQLPAGIRHTGLSASQGWYCYLWSRTSLIAWQAFLTAVRNDPKGGLIP